jgi:hypothetical protein
MENAKKELQGKIVDGRPLRIDYSKGTKYLKMVKKFQRSFYPHLIIF